MNRALVVVPTFNERHNVRPLVEAIIRGKIPLEMLVVDDNSPDGTAGEVESLQKQYRGLHLLKRPQKRGLASAYKDGFAWGLHRDYDSFIMMDADFSHDPACLPILLGKLESHDVCVGSRYVPGGGSANWPLHRIVLSWTANRYARVVTDVPINDLTSGFIAVKRPALEAASPQTIPSEGYSFLIELKWRMYQNQAQMTEIPIIFTERTAGVSKISKFIVWEAFWVVMRLAWKSRHLSRSGN